jgi:hypothetical protein
MEEENFLQLFTFFVLLNSMVVITIVALHEFGHGFLGILMECKDIKILISFPNIEVLTEMTCQKGVEVVSFGAFLFTIPFSLSLLILKKPEKKLWLIALGLSFFTASSDISQIGSPLFYILILFGLGLIVYGEDEFIKALIE